MKSATLTLRSFSLGESWWKPSWSRIPTFRHSSSTNSFAGIRNKITSTLFVPVSHDLFCDTAAADFFFGSNGSIIFSKGRDSILVQEAWHTHTGDSVSFRQFEHKRRRREARWRRGGLGQRERSAKQVLNGRFWAGCVWINSIR